MFKLEINNVTNIYHIHSNLESYAFKTKKEAIKAMNKLNKAKESNMFNRAKLISK